jgi:hypothetical protein
MTQTLPVKSQFPADWYDDPHAPGGRVKRFWDGIAWTDFVYDLGIDFAVSAPGPAEDGAVSVTRLHPPPKHAEDVVAEEVVSISPDEAPKRKIRRLGARKVAQQLAEENDELKRQMSELTETVARIEAELEQLQPVNS